MKKGDTRRGPFSLRTIAVSAMPSSPADPRPDHHAGADLILMRGRLPARILDRLGGGAHRKGDELVDLALLLGLHPLIRIVGAVLAVAARNLACDLGGQVGDLEFLDAARAALALEETRPRRLDAAGERRHHAHSGDDNTSHVTTSLAWRTPGARETRTPMATSRTFFSERNAATGGKCDPARTRERVPTRLDPPGNLPMPA